ncbi:MAG: LysR family transcriptional regulator [Rhodobacteraceae bacterium]|nr:LysR family transcriptional regulator [Paracoccaceae bacterium]
MKLSHLNGLRALEASLRHGGFSAAAAELGVTPAAVGQQIRGLEAFLGRKLFRRSGQGTTPTEAAKQLEAQLTSGFSQVAEALARLSSAPEANRLSVTLPASFAENWLMPRISAFYGIASEVDLRIDATNRMVDLLAEDFDFALRYSPPTKDPFDDTELFGDRVLPVCSPDFAITHKASLQEKSLKGVPLVHLENRTPDPSWPDWKSWTEQFGIDMKQAGKIGRFTQFSSGLQAAISGQAMVLCGVTEAFNGIQSGQLILPFGPASHRETDYRYRLVSVRGRPATSLKRKFRDWILGEAKQFRKQVAVLLAC